MDGAELHAGALEEAELLRIEQSTAALADAPGVRLPNLSDIADLLAADGLVGGIAARVLGPKTRPVRAILFDKRADLNWSLPMHQDRTIAVMERRETPGFGPWSVKAGLPHVEPPYEVTARMVTLRVHLDDVDADNAPLLILRGSHGLGRLPEARIEALEREAEPFACLAKRGDVWAYRTEIVHGSTTARVPGRRRRVLQLDYAAEDLPGGLKWAAV